MKIRMAAFTLFEMMVALALTSILSLLVAHWVASSHLLLRHHAQRSARAMALQSMQNVLSRDMLQAPADPREWFVTDRGMYVWRTPTGDISWHVEADALYRTQGQYDAKKHHWIKQKKSCAAVAIHQCTVKPIYKNSACVMAVQATLMALIDGAPCTFSLYELLHNGEVV